jgi:ligand-binding sensor domain-containing protein/signal transduction histidine kinase
MGGVTSKRFMRLTVGDGLSMASVTGLAQDHRGLMWFATQNGANVFNGIQVQQYFHEPGNSDSVRDNFVRDVVVDEAGRIWIATLSGLDRYDPITGRFVHYDLARSPFNGATTKAITSMLAGNGQFWVGTLEAGLFRYNPDSDQFVRLPTDLAAIDRKHEGVMALGLDPQGQLWIATLKSKILVSVDGQQKAVVQQSVTRGLPAGTIRDIEFTQDGDALFAIETSGLLKMSADGSLSLFGHDPNDPDSLPSNDILDIHISSNQRVWVATGNGLAFMRAPGRFDTYYHDPQNPTSLSDNRVFHLFEDRGGVMWVSTNNGVSRFKVTNEVFQLYQNGDGKQTISHNRIKALFAKHNHLWVGTFGGGLNRVDLTNNEVMVLRHDPGDPNSLSSDNVFAIDQLGDELYVGTYGGGVDVIDLPTGKVRKLDQSQNKTTDPRVLRILAEETDRVWIGTWTAMHLYNPETDQILTVGHDIEQDFNLSSTTVREIVRDSKDRLWVGSFGNGLYSYDHINRRVKNWRYREGDPTSISQDRVLCMVEDQQERLWIGTLGGGLNRFFPETGTFRHVPLGETKAYRVIVGLLLDAEGMIWMSTYSGILRLNPQDESVTRYTDSDGLQGLEFNSGAYAQLPDGRLSFGGTQGVNIFDPLALDDKVYRPPVILTGFKIYNQDIPLHDDSGPIQELDVNYDQKVLSFEYTALDFADPAGVRYAYMLEGFDMGWQDAELRRHATYTNLDPGNYRFRVKAASSAGVWNEVGTALNIRVIPPFYMRTWFYLLLGFVILVLVRYWSWNHKRQKRILQNRVEERTRDLRETNLRLADTIRELEETARELRKTQAKVAEAAHRAGMAEIASDVLHSIGNGMNSLLVSTEQMQRYMQELPGKFLVNIADLIDSNGDGLGPFFKTDRGRRLPGTLRSLGELLSQRGDMALKECQKMNERCFQISGILNSQRQYAFDDDYLEEMDIRSVVDDMLSFQSANLGELNVQVNRHYEHVPRVVASKSRLIHILNHLIRNASDALKGGQARDNRWLSIWIRNQPRQMSVLLEIRDNGSGIDDLTMEQMFNQGFTTKQGASGYGLHYCMLSLGHMGGKIRAESLGEGQGASFFVEIPTRQVPRKQPDDAVSISV